MQTCKCCWMDPCLYVINLRDAVMNSKVNRVSWGCKFWAENPCDGSIPCTHLEVTGALAMPKSIERSTLGTCSFKPSDPEIKPRHRPSPPYLHSPENRASRHPPLCPRGSSAPSPLPPPPPPPPYLRGSAVPSPCLRSSAARSPLPSLPRRGHFCRGNSASTRSGGSRLPRPDECLR